MKIDVEGFEHAVLLGAADLIARDRPVIQMEIEKTHNPHYTDVLEWMEQNKYHGFSLEDTGINDNFLSSLEMQSIHKNLPPNAEISDQYEFLLIPNDKINTFADLIIP